MTIKQRRIALGMSQTQLARLAKVTLRAVDMMESRLMVYVNDYKAVQAALDAVEKSTLDHAHHIITRRGRK